MRDVGVIDVTSQPCNVRRCSSSRRSSWCDPITEPTDKVATVQLVATPSARARGEANEGGYTALVTGRVASVTTGERRAAVSACYKHVNCKGVVRSHP
jgi:hypothetical protein